MKTFIKFGISSCLLGERVRWNSDHRLERSLTDTLGKFVEYVPACPKVECGFNIPREPFRLVGDPNSPRLITSRTKQDHTDRMIQWVHKRVRELEKEELSGFIFKSNSPTSGMERVKVYNETGISEKKGVGIFARGFMGHFPLLPVEEKGRLHDPKPRENFIERIFTLERWREGLGGKVSRGNLVDFHTKHKMLILSHSPHHHRVMGKLVAQAKDIALKVLYEQYQKLLMEAFRLRSTLKKNTNVLMHIVGYFRKQLSPDEKQALLEISDLYRQGSIPLIVPITLVNHYERKYDQPHLKEQYYLHPHSLELQLQNHA